MVNVLESLDNALGESEDNDRELVELTEKYEMLAQQYEKERHRRKEAEEVCVLAHVCMHAYHVYHVCTTATDTQTHTYVRTHACWIMYDDACLHIASFYPIHIIRLYTYVRTYECT